MGEGESPGSGTRGVAAGIGTFVAWGLFPIYWKALQTVPPFEVLCHRVVWSAVFLSIVTAAQGGWGEVRQALGSPGALTLSLVSSTCIGANWFVYIWAISSGYVLETSLGYYINPLVNVVIGRVLFSERPRGWQLVAVLLAAAGVLNLTLGYGRFPWVALALAGTFGMYGAVRKAARVGSIAGVTIETWVLSPLALAALVALQSRGTGAFAAAGASVSLLLAGSGVVTSMPLVGFTYAVRRLRLTTVAILQFISPTMVFFLGVYSFGEPFTRSHLVTFLCIWLGVAAYTFETVRSARRLRRLSEGVR